MQNYYYVNGLPNTAALPNSASISINRLYLTIRSLRQAEPVLALVGEIIEFFAGAGSAKKAGASWGGALAAIGGTIAGAIVGTFLIPVPIVGTLLGACIGAGLGTWSVERLIGKPQDKSVKSGVGAGVGVFVGTTTKFLIGCLIWLIIAVATFWP
jgi:uncharacterized protein YqgC (DUF456 family)